MKKALSYVLGALGITAVIPIYIILALSIPLSVLAIVHVTSWGLWKALILFGFLSFLPVINLLMFFAPFLGAYYLITNDFDWHKAAYPNSEIEILNYTKMSNAEFEKYKTENLLPGILEGCKQEAAKKGGFEGKISPTQNSYCICFSQKLANQITKEDLEKSEKDKNYFPLNEKDVKQMVMECSDLR